MHLRWPGICLQFLVVVFLTSGAHTSPAAWLAPVDVDDRSAWESLKLTSIGSFGLLRKARPSIPEHFHTGIDIMRPRGNYDDDPIFPASEGIVISTRDDGPLAQIIIEHQLENGLSVWSVHEHIAGIGVAVGDRVNAYEPIARFMSKDELNKYGWQFDHLHFEILKRRPRPLKPTSETPHRFFGTYSIECYSHADLDRHYYDPTVFSTELGIHPP